MFTPILHAFSAIHDWLESPLDVVKDLTANGAIKALGASTCVVTLNCLGGSWVAARALLMLMCIDFALGFYRAWMSRHVSSQKLQRGFSKFLFYSIGVICAHHLDVALNDKVSALFRAHFDFTGFLILYLVLCEALSAFKHLHCLGMPVPKLIINRLETLRNCDFPGSSKQKDKRSGG